MIQRPIDDPVEDDLDLPILYRRKLPLRIRFVRGLYARLRKLRFT